MLLQYMYIVPMLYMYATDMSHCVERNIVCGSSRGLKQVSCFAPFINNIYLLRTFVMVRMHTGRPTTCVQRVMTTYLV